MKKLIFTLMLVTIMLFGSAALAEGVVLPDPAYYFGKAYTYDEEYIVFDEYPKAEFDAYKTLLIEKYGMEVYDEGVAKNGEHCFLNVPGDAKGEMYVQCFQDSKGVFGMAFYFENITLRELDTYDPSNNSEPGEMSKIELPDPEFYFNRGYTHTGTIVFDDYPQAEYEAYVSLLQEAYGMKVVEKDVSVLYELVYLEAPGIKDSRTCVACYTNSQDSGIEFDFGKSITLSALDVYTPSAECAICSGDAVCDTCGGKGYLEMTAYGSKDTVRVACTAGCTDGKCPACGAEIDLPIPAQDTKTYTPPIVGNDGLIVMSPEQYLGISPCDGLFVSYDGCYDYHYDGYGWEYEGEGSDENWAMMVSYVNALVDSGYYEISDHQESRSSESWKLRYIGPAEIIRGTYDIQVKSSIGNCIVMYRISTVAAADLQEKLIYFNMEDLTPKSDDDSPSILKTCSVCNGDRKCRYCRGKGTDSITGGDCAVCHNGKCYACNGTGHE